MGSAGDVNGDGYADVIVGARNYANGQTDEGAACVFLGGPNGVANGNPNTAAARLESNLASALLGSSVASAGDVNGDGYADVIAGAPSFANGQTDEGAAFVSLGGAQGILDGNPATAAAQLESNQIGAGNGSGAVINGITVAGAGDVNGDGYPDVIVGAAYYDAGEFDEGAAFVFLGGPMGIADGNPASAAAQLESNQAQTLFGDSVAGAGDVNGDGYSDVIVGASSYDAGQTDEGAAFVFLGSSTGIASGNPASPGVTQLESDQAGAQMGWSVAGLGDVNGDGYADVIVGAPWYAAGQTNEGAAFVFHGSATGIADGNPTTAAAQLEGGQVNTFFGASVAGAGDVNGDGYADAIVGAARVVLPSVFPSARVFLGSTGGLSLTSSGGLETDQADTFPATSISVAGAGDVNGDGYADVIVGFGLYDAGQPNEGAAFVLLGSASGIANHTPSTAAAQLEGNQANAVFGASVAGAGDVNGDGYADVIVGAINYDAGETDEGAAFVFLGSPSGVADGNPATAAAQLEANQAGAGFGSSVAGAGDVNGDGYADVIVGAWQYDAGEMDEGAAFVFLGNSQGRPVRAHQQRGDWSGRPVQAWGGSYSPTGFAVELTASHPAGTGRVKAEIQACPSGVAFGAVGCTTVMTPIWVVVNGAAPEVVIADHFAGLTTGTLYRWRARILHAPRTGPVPLAPAHGPWRRFQAQAVEADVRVVPEPSFVVSLASGLALLAVLARRRRRRA